MSKVELKQLTLTNYRNIDYATYQFDGNSKIIGENGIGKTNTLEAVIYLLTDKLLNGSADITAIKPLKDTSKEVVVKGTFLIDGTTTVELKKSYKEQWVKTRGSNELIFKGHTTTYYFNDVKQGTLRDYNIEVNKAFGIKIETYAKIEIERLLIDPFYCGDLGDSKDWTNLRTFIIELVGDVNDDDVFEQHPELANIKETLKSVNGRVDQAKKKVKQTIAGLKEQLIADDAQIKTLSETTKPSDDAVAIAKKGIEEHETIIANLRANNGVDQQSVLIEKDLLKAKQDVLDYKSQQSYKSTDNHSQKELDDLLLKKDKLISEKEKHEWLLNQLNLKVKDFDDKRTELVNRVNDIDSKLENIESNVETTCPLCGKPLDADKVAHNIEVFKTQIENEKKAIIEKGKANNDEKENVLTEIATLKSKIEECDMSIECVNVDIHSKQLKINDEQEKILKENAEVEQACQVELNKLETKVQELEQKLAKSKDDFFKGTQDIEQKVFDEQQAMQPFKTTLADLDYYNRNQARLKDIEKVKEEHSTNLINAEQEQEMFDKFIRVKLEMLDTNVSKVFGNIKFQLIQENINGGYDTVCKPYIYDVEKGTSTNVLWKSGSKSERVITGVAIAEAIKSKLELPNLPFLFDEGGEISTETFKNKFKTNSQLICVKVVDNILTPKVVAIDN